MQQAAISLLPDALPVWLQTELISNRQLDSTAIIFRVLTAFQPGGLSEKSAILDALTRSVPGKAFSDTLIALRTWNRLKQRAEELKATIPDPSILVVALDRPCSSVLSTNPNISFRSASFRHELNIDTIPTYDKVDQLSMVILAELEGAVGNESQMGRKDRLALSAENSEEAKATSKGNQENGRPKDPPKAKKCGGSQRWSTPS